MAHSAELPLLPASLKQQVSHVPGTVIFTALICLVVVTAIPYGTVEAWWKAFFVCVIFALAIVWLIDGLMSGCWIRDGGLVVLPVAVLAALSFLQTLSFGSLSGQTGEIPAGAWHAISADPLQTRFFLQQLLGLMLAGVLLFRYVSTEGRLRTLVNAVIGVAVVSAIFGILRQTSQHQLGFGLPLLPVGAGYGQFINQNHFAFLMEMGLGLSLGMIVAGGKREQALIYFAALLPVWTAMVLCGSRGALLAMLAQVIAAALLFSLVVRTGHPLDDPPKLLRLTKSLPIRLALLTVLVGGVAFGTVWLGGDQLAGRIEQSRTEFGSDQTESRRGASRKEIWRVTLKMFAAHPMLGVGMGAYWAAVPSFHDAAGTMMPQEAHNDYLELLASGGLVGLAIFVWFAAVVIRRTWTNLHSAHRFRRAACFGAAIGMIGVAVHSLVDFGLHMIVNALVFTTLVAIATSNPQWVQPKAYE